MNLLPILKEINNIRGDAPGISRRHIFEIAIDNPEYPVINGLFKHYSPRYAVNIIGRTLNEAGWKRTARTSTYWFVE